MRFHKPHWLTHAGEKKDHEVYSCHVSPDGTRLATAGGDGHVRIWSTEAILNANNPAYTKPKQLAVLSYHSGTVHSVRFSGNGKYLASGADDKIVCVYRLEEGAPTGFGKGFGGSDGVEGEQPTENWKIFRRLIGHDNDVQDLGWSCDSSILVSVGLDSKVVVWSGSTFEKLKTLSQHQSHVKGITFDPANKYFATASDDRTVKIYRFTSPPANATAYDQTSNFILETTVSGPFEGSPLTTYFRRPSWSPEGNHIAAANAVNGPVSSVAIIDRGAWASEINLIGHEGPVEVCAFSPRLFCRDPPPPLVPGKENEYVSPPIVTIIACAGQDRTLSIWNTTFPRPFATTAELAAKSISDLAWSPEGETVFITALDGTIAGIVFERGELGYPALVADNIKALAKFGAGRGRVGVAEGVDAVRLEEGSKLGETRSVEGRMGELMGDSAAGAGAAVMTNGDSIMADASTGVVNGLTNGVSGGASKEGTPAPAMVAPKDPQQEKVEKLKQRVTFTKEGKKRIAPLLVSSSNLGENNLPRGQLQAAVKNGAASDDVSGRVLDLSKPYDGLPKGGLASLLIGNKRKFAEIDGEPGAAERRAQQSASGTGAVPIVVNTGDGLVPASSAEGKKALEEKAETAVPEVLRPAITNPSLTTSSIRLAVPMVRRTILRPLDPSSNTSSNLTGLQQDPSGPSTASTSSSSLVFEARHAAPTANKNQREPTRITLTSRSQPLWQDYLPRPVLLTTGSPNFWAAGCEDGSLYVWTPAGRRLFNALVLESAPVIMDCLGWWLLVVTAVGNVWVWDLSGGGRVLLKGKSLAPVLDSASLGVGSGERGLTQGPSLMFARLNSAGKVVVGMSNGEGFVYSTSMCVWQRLSESWWAVGSQYWNTLDTAPAAPASSASANSTSLSTLKPENILSAGIVPLLERNTTAQALLKGRAYFLQRLVKQLLNAEGFEGFETTVSIAHLENRVAAALTLGAKDEFRIYLLMYVRRIGAEGLRGKVEELLSGLAGGAFFEDEDGEDGGSGGIRGVWGKGEEVVGWKREELLKEVVVALGKFRELQRVTVPYARALGVLDGFGGGGDGLRRVTES